MAAAAEETATGEVGWSLEAAAAHLGATEAALRLFISIVMGYPFGLFHRQFLSRSKPHIIHLYNIALGLWIAYFNFGFQMFHSLICVLFQFLVLRLTGRTVTAVTISLLFQMIYLLAGYYYTATDQYDIKWTMPHCVLTLKLIGLSLDYYDGGKEKSQLSKEQEQYSIPGELSLLEVAGFAYFYGAFLVGPQFPVTNYLRLAAGEMTDRPGLPPSSVMPALKRLSLGLLYVCVYTVAQPYFPDDYFLTSDYANRSLAYKCLFIAFWGKVSLTKYVSCWLVAEGVCILTGLGYNGTDEGGRVQWDACTNIKVLLFETDPYFKGTIAAFNIQTNLWAARHVFKRLKFLGSKMLSQGLTLTFLAIWHGLHSGYFMCFFMEFVITYHESQVSRLVEDSPLLRNVVSRPELAPVLYMVQQTFHWLFMGYSLVSFCLFAWDRWFKVYHSVYFLGHAIFLSQILLIPTYRRILVPKKRTKHE